MIDRRQISQSVQGALAPRAIVVLLLIALMAACGSPESSQPSDRQQAPIASDALRIDTQGKTGGTLRYALGGEPRTFNPLAANDVRSKLISGLFSATILEFDPIERRIVPGLAQTWEVSPDGRGIEITLRQGLRFGDGSPLTVEDAVLTLQAITGPQSRNSVRDSLLFPGQSLEVEKLDEQRLRISLSQPDASLEFLLTTVPVLPRRHMPADHSTLESHWNLETPVEEITGLGPFRLAAHNPGESTVLERNPHYWKTDAEGTRLPYLDRIEVLYVADADSQILRLRGGQLDLVDQALTPENFRLLAGDDGIGAQNAGPSPRLALLWFNLNLGSDAQGQLYLPQPKRNWFAEPRFRRAVALAISREELSRVVFSDQATPASGLIAAWNEGWHRPPESSLERDTESARRLLAEAGFSWRGESDSQRLIGPKGDPVRFELLSSPAPQMTAMAEMIQQDLKAIGIEASLRQEEFRSIASRVMGSRRYDAVLANFSFPIEPSDLSNVLLSSGAMHLWNPRQQSPASDWERRIDQLMAEQRSLLDEDQRRERIFEVQRIMAQELPILPLLNYDILAASRSRLRNLKPAPDLTTCCLWNAWELYLDSE